ncbi:MAG: ribonuclease HII [bacterium]|nr:ribonuclease HII [bacterium]
MILGIDEVGRGPWAGPLVVGAVVLDQAIEGLTDSKKLSKKRREALDGQIRQEAAGYGLGWVSAAEIDEIGLSQGLVLATKRAVEQVKAPYHEIIIDGTINFLKDTSKGGYVTTIAKADLLIPSVSAASIIAKVARDNYMAEQADIYPEYGFGSHVGYGTKQHREAIDSHGVTPLHRLSFAPLAKYRDSAPVEAELKTVTKTTRAIGDSGESAAASYLRDNKYEVIERNWKNKYCEIDIVATKKDVYYFVEVKHRKNKLSGDGLDAITPKKKQQMEFAAKVYAHWNKITDTDMRLMVIATAGSGYAIEAVVEIN